MVKDVVTIRAEWDDEVSVWVVSSDDVPGLHSEADTYEDIARKAAPIIEDLAEFDPSLAPLVGLPLEVVTHRRHELMRASA